MDWFLINVPLVGIVENTVFDIATEVTKKQIIKPNPPPLSI